MATDVHEAKIFFHCKNFVNLLPFEDDLEAFSTFILKLQLEMMACHQLTGAELERPRFSLFLLLTSLAEAVVICVMLVSTFYEYVYLFLEQLFGLS